MTHKVKLFVSYSHLDEPWKDKLYGHLSFLRQYGDMAEIWQDRKITGGSEWKTMIDKGLHESNIVLLLVSSDFLKSNYCYYIEFEEAMKRHKNKDAIVIPVIIRDAYWQWRDYAKDKGLVDLQAFPTDGKPVSNGKYWSSEDEAFTVVAKNLELVVKQLTTKPPVDTTNLTQAQMVAQKLFANHVAKSASNGMSHQRSPKLYDALVNLNYIEQKATFSNFLDSGHNIGAFLLLGAYECGHDWILNRLLRQSPDVEACLATCLHIRIEFKPQRCGRNLGDLWEELALHTGQDVAEPEAIIEAIHSSWQTQTVLLTLRGIEHVEESYLQDFITRFWYPLVQKQPPTEPNYCMMFMLDGKGNKWEFARSFDTTWKPNMPIDLGKLAKFSKAELKRWRPGEAARLAPAVTLEKILEDSDNGLPEPVLKKICRLSGDSWIRREKEWNPY